MIDPQDDGLKSRREPGMLGSIIAILLNLTIPPSDRRRQRQMKVMNDLAKIHWADALSGIHADSLTRA